MPSHSTELGVVIADDHPHFRLGLSFALKTEKQIRLLGEATNGRELCLQVEKLKPNVVITDINMPIMNGIDAARHIRQHYPQTGVVILSMHEDMSVIKEAVQADIHAYLPKTADAAELIRAIKSASAGRFFFSANSSLQMSDLIHFLCIDHGLTKREMEIIGYLFEEFTSKQIGEKMHISERTVEEYRKHILDKTGAKNTIGIIKYALRHNIIKM